MTFHVKCCVKSSFTRVCFHDLLYHTVYTKEQMNIREIQEQVEWDELAVSLKGHPLQLWGWGELKATGSWRAYRVVIESDEKVIGGAQILVRRLPWPFRRLNYIPRGPFGGVLDSPEAMQLLADNVRHRIGGTHLAMDPDVTDWQPVGKWQRGANNFLVAKTLVLDLAQTEDELLSAMAKKTRQYIRKSAQSGLMVRQLTTEDELQQAMKVYHQTAQRAGFALHDDEYYYDCARLLDNHCVVYGAFFENELVSFVWLVESERVAFELYGGMTERGQQLRANYALKWHAIRAAKRRGVAYYDMNGLLNDGVSTFKRGFSDHDTQLVGAFDYPFSPLYGVWSTLLPMGKKIVQLIKSLLKKQR